MSATRRAVGAELVEALAVVGVTSADVWGVLGDQNSDAECYLVGSLAAGYGNRGSDVDIHCLIPEALAGIAPMLHFINEVRVDVTHIDRNQPETLFSRLPSRSVPFAHGRCAMGTLPNHGLLKRLIRWSCAVPLDPLTGPIFDEDATEVIGASATRAALEQSVRLGCLAVLLDDTASAVAGIAWSRAAAQLVETVLRSSGQLFSGDKWLSIKLERAYARGDLRPDFAANVHNREGFEQIRRDLELPQMDLLSLGVVVSVEAELFRLNGSSFRRIGSSLVPDEPVITANLSVLRSRNDAQSILRWIASGLARLTVDTDLLDEVIA